MSGSNEAQSAALSPAMEGKAPTGSAGIGRGDANSLYQQATQALHNGRLDDCLSYARQLESLIGPHSSVFHLRALSLHRAGKLSMALECFEQSIAALPSPSQDPYVFANAAIAYEAAGVSDRAIALMASASNAGPNAFDIQLAQLEMHRRLLGNEACLKGFETLVKRHPNRADVFHHQALFLRDICRPSEAERAAVQAVELNTQSLAARHLVARIQLEAGAGDPEAFLKLSVESGDDETLIMGAAAAFIQHGESDQALWLLDRKLAEHPHWSGVAITRLSIAQQLFSPDIAANWLKLQLGRHPPIASLCQALVTQLWRAQGAQNAHQALVQFPKELLETRELLLLRSELVSEIGQYAEADILFSRLKPSGHAVDVQLDLSMIRHLLRTRQFEQALELALNLATLGCVEAWVYIEIVWRLTSHPAWDWLMADGRLIEQTPLLGFDEIKVDLLAEMHALHANLKHHPLDQSPRLGTQTDGHLFRRMTPAIRAFIAIATSTVESYLAQHAGLEPLANHGIPHPYSRLKPHNFKFSGAWSILLGKLGFHEPHFHSQGQISSACHLIVPQVQVGGAKTMRTKHAGWLELGRPPTSLNLDLEPFCILEPRVGFIALFPSFLFHGTRPFEEGERMSIAFDVAGP
ncbi:MAG: hypothetical protein RL764_1602 [Pseudomonadota bacterium]